MAALEGGHRPIHGSPPPGRRGNLPDNGPKRVQRGIRGPWIGLVFQNAALFDFLNVRGNLAWPLLESGVARDEVETRVLEALGMVELPPDRYLDRDPATLSGGERKRVALARALVLRPKIILYDEPTAGLDPPTAAEINRLIRRLNQERGITSAVTTHDMQSARMVADRVVMMKNGEVVFTGSYDEAEREEDVKHFITGGAEA